MYFPKSQIITDLTTNGSEFVLASNGEKYVGSYFSTSNGKNYTGKTPQDGITALLVPIPNTNTNEKTKGLPETSPLPPTTPYLPKGYRNSSNLKKLPSPPKSSIVLPTT